MFKMLSIYESYEKNKILEIGTLPLNRVSRLKRLLLSKKIVRILESHNSLTGLIIENLKVPKKGMTLFQCQWAECYYIHDICQQREALVLSQLKDMIRQ